MADVRKCQCGTPKTTLGGYHLCRHCDRPHPDVRVCAACMNYNAAVNIRVLTEWKAQQDRGNG